MENVDLGALKAEHLLGSWDVQDRLGVTSDDWWTHSRRITFSLDGEFRAENGGSYRGTWRLHQEREVVYNPQILFNVEAREATRGLVTRLRRVDDTTQQLTLYLATGTELQLRREVSQHFV